MSAAAYLAAISAGADLASAVGQGIGGIQAAKKLKLTPEEEEEQRKLEEARKGGQLGMTEEQRGAMNAMFLAEQSSGARQAQQAQMVAAATRGPAVSGREVFLEEQARQAADLKRVQAENALRNQAEQVAAAQQEARLFNLQGQEQAAEIAMTEAITGVVTGSLDSISASADVQAQRSAAGELDFTKGMSDADLMKLYLQSGGGGDPSTAYTSVAGIV